MKNSSLIVYLNGNYLPLSEARVSVMDRGFLFGDGVYEMIPVYGNCIFRLEEHLSRLQDSLKATGMANPHSNEEWEMLMDKLLAENPVSDHRSIYVEVTRGVGDRDHIYDEQLNPTVFMLCRPVASKDYSSGVAAITHPDIRWEYCHIKSISLLPAVMLKNRAKCSDEAHEAILIRDGEVTEGASSNVFVVRNGVIKTPPKGNRLLPGITRDLVLELLQRDAVECEESAISEVELRDADEIWITSSVMEIAPVIKLDGRDVGEGRPGSLWRRARGLYESFKRDIAAAGGQGREER